MICCWADNLEVEVKIINLKEIKQKIAEFYQHVENVEIKTNKKDLFVRVAGKKRKKFVNLKILLNVINRTYQHLHFDDGLIRVGKKRYIRFVRKHISQETLNKPYIPKKIRSKK
ncbi:MAG: hypothetical protein PHF17_08405 [Arcobacteraceae bacterium]|nr:hypothetical protein [Arcobacteraceae bacterium]